MSETPARRSVRLGNMIDGRPQWQVAVPWCSTHDSMMHPEPDAVGPRCVHWLLWDSHGPDWMYLTDAADTADDGCDVRSDGSAGVWRDENDEN